MQQHYRFDRGHTIELYDEQATRDNIIRKLEEKGYIITSAGTLGSVGFPATNEAIRSCAAKGVDISSHRSRALSRLLIEQSDVVFVMTQGHREAVTEISPEAADKCFLLAKDTDIPDPIGQSQSFYDDCAEMIDKMVRKRLLSVRMLFLRDVVHKVL